MQHANAPSGEMLEPWRSVSALADVLNAGADRPTFSESAIRNLLAKRAENGLQQYVVKLNRKLLISEPGFNCWIAQHNQGSGA